MFISILLIIIATIIIVYYLTKKRKSEAVPECQIQTIEEVIDPDFSCSDEFDDDRTFVALDCETATTDRMICEIGVVVVENGVITAKKDYLIRPPMNRYDEQTIRVHHITPRITENCPSLKEVWPEIKAMLKGKQLVAHNAAFDSDAINKSLNYYHLPQILTRFICTSKMLDKIDLLSACTFYGIDMGNHHNALDDALSCALLRLAYLDNPVSGKDIPRIKHTKIPNTKCGQGDLLTGDPNSPFYGSTCVLSGVFMDWFDRNELAEKLISLGARVTSSISGRTDYLIIGDSPGPAKVEKAEMLQAQGGSIQIIDEFELSEMLNN